MANQISGDLRRSLEKRRTEKLVPLPSVAFPLRFATYTAVHIPRALELCERGKTRGRGCQVSERVFLVFCVFGFSVCFRVIEVLCIQ